MGWLARWRRRRVLRRHRIDEALWRQATRSLACIESLSAKDAARLKELVLVFLAEKQFEAAGGIRITDAMRLSIAAQACLLVLGLGFEWLEGWTSIVVYPGDFRVKRSELDENGVLHEWDDDLAGEALPGGPVVLSWDAAAHDTGMSVVIHEFAHKLDMLNGVADGFPRLHADMDRAAWASAFHEAYAGFCDAVERGNATWLDPYAAEHPSEFFAVMSEAFFEAPAETRRRYPDIYAQLALFYRQDPAVRACRLPS